MARSNFISDIQDSFLSCPICFQSYQRPKALPCLHSFCEECLRDYIVSRYDRNEQFPCPICRQAIYLPPNGAFGFPDNHFVISLLATVNEKEPSGLSDISDSLRLDERQPLIQGESRVAFGRLDAKVVSKFGKFGMESNGLIQISGLCLNSLTDDLIVVDCSLNKILVFALDGHFRGGFVCDCSIRDAAITSTGTILISVSRSGSSILREYSMDGRKLASYGSFHKYENPFGVAITSRGKVVVTSLQYNSINILTERKKPSIKFGSRGSGPNHFILPYYVAINSKDDIIVSDTGNHRVKIHKNDGSIVLTFGQKGSNFGELFYPMGVCMDKYDNIYVADANNFRVQIFSPTGVFLACPVSSTYEFGTDVKPVNVLVAGKRLFVSFRGTKFAEVREYSYTLPSRNPDNLKQKGGGLLCCCKNTSLSYDDL